MEIQPSKYSVRNPLGVVALFISLIYGIAALLLGAAASTLASWERAPLIGFVVTFPVIVLYVFYLLVTKHHGKLYGPGDYERDDSFLRTLSDPEKEARLDAEVEETIREVQIPAQNVEVRREVIREKLINAEQLALSQLEKELGIEPEKGVNISPDQYYFDAEFRTEEDEMILVEIKYLWQSWISTSVVKEFLYKATLTSEYMSLKTSFIMVLVCDFEEDKFDSVIQTWDHAVEDSKINVSLRLFNSSGTST